MASAAPQKRMVSSVFITLSSPHRATVTQQQQPALHTQSGSAADRQHTAARVCPPGDNLSALRHKTEDQSPSNAHGSGNSKNWTHVRPPAKGPDRQSQPQPDQTGPTKVEVQEKNRSSSEILPPPPPHPASDMLPSLFSEDSALPPPPPSLTSSIHPRSPDQRPVFNKEVCHRYPCPA
ncbi:hypothetical protein CHARACLAT_023559 [Characodon lateralis]|uniref:Uncharacterized protein n=1 Tax=Characodon lateralis TaxID=208331 RepID=A0ABU7DLI3_9TELE|nr:hypothetical protein [Characodon lateralis]